MDDEPVKTATQTSVRNDMWQRIGGPNAITWHSFIVTLGFTLVLGSLGSSAAGFGWTWLIPALIGQFVAYGVLWIARVTVLRTSVNVSRPGRTLAAFVVAALLGSNASGAIAGALSGADDVRSDSVNGWLVIAAILATVTSFTIVASFAAIIVDAYREHVIWTSTRNSKLQQLSDLRSRGTDAFVELQRSWRSTILQELHELQRQTPHSGLTELESSIRHSAFEVLRPFSHELARGTPSDIPTSPTVPGGIRDFLIDVYSRGPIRGIWLAMLSSITPGFFVFFHVNFPDSLFFMILFVVVTAILGSLLLQLVQSMDSAKSRVLGTVVGNYVLATTPVPLAFAIVGEEFGGQSAATSAFAIAVFGLLGPAVHGGRIAFLAEQRDRGQIESAIEHEMSLFRQREQLERTTLSRIVHGRIQSTLLACALELSSFRDQDLNPADETVLRARLEHTLQQLADRMGAPQAIPDLSQGLREIEELWGALCVFDIEVDRATRRRLTPLGVSSVLALVEEICTNAIRHGNAHRIQIRITSTSRNFVTLDVTSSQSSPAVPTRQGLGSSLLDELTQSWEVETNEFGTRTFARVSIS